MSLKELNFSKDTTIFLPKPSGGDDLAAINAVFSSAAAGSICKALPGSTYKISGPITVHSYQTADFRNSTIQFLNSTIQTNMLNNAAVLPVATATDASTTVGSSVVVSPTLAAVAQVGQQMAVVAAGPDGGNVNLGSAGPIWLYGTIQSIAGNNITLGGNVNGVAAHRVVSGATAYLYNRDQHIEIIGGTWDAGTNWNDTPTRYTKAFLTNQLRLRRVDHLTVRGVLLKQSGFPQGGGWCFGVNPGDCTNFLIEDITGEGSSVAVEGEGPLYRGIIRNIRGQTQDDHVALGTVGAAGADIEGDITDVLIDGVLANSSLRALTLFAGQGSNGASRPIRGVSARGLKGRTINEPVRVVEYAGNADIDCELTEPITAQAVDYPTHKNYLITNSVSQPLLKVRGPLTGRDALPTPGGIYQPTKTSNQTAIGTGFTDTSLVIQVDAPPSGVLWIETFIYSFLQNTSAGQPTVSIADVTGATVGLLTLFQGTIAAAGFSPNFQGRVKVTGLTPGASYIYRVRAKTTAGTMDLQAAPTTTAYIRAIVGTP